MTDVRAKLAELGLTLPVAANPVAAYVPAIRTGNIVLEQKPAHFCTRDTSSLCCSVSS